MTMTMNRPHATTVLPLPGNRVQPWEAPEHPTGSAECPIYHDQVTGYLVRCRRHGHTWWTPTAEHARELSAEPYAWCDEHRAETDASATALLRRKVWVVKVRAFDPDGPEVTGGVLQTYQVKGEPQQSREAVIRSARRTFRSIGLDVSRGLTVTLERA